MKFLLVRKALPSLLMLFGSVMALSVGLASAFIPGLAHLNYCFPIGEPKGYVEYRSSFRVYETPWVTMSSIGGLLCLTGFIAHSKNYKRLIPHCFAGTSLGLLGFLLFIWDFGRGRISVDYTYIVIPWLGLSLTFLGVLMMFTGSVARFHIVPRLLYLLAPALVSSLAYNILVITNNLPYILLIARSVHSHAIVGLPLLLILALIFLGSIYCLIESTRLQAKDVTQISL